MISASERAQDVGVTITPTLMYGMSPFTYSFLFFIPFIDLSPAPLLKLPQFLLPRH